jgi:RsiW-degrading membrane proteinase PrsW (M82 family)
VTQPPAAPAPAPATAGLIGGHLFAVFVAALGGALGIIGAGVNELRTGGFLLLPIIGAPVIEEVAKPVGVYLLLARWPRLLHGQLHIAFLAAVAGLSFALIESLVYITIYVPDHSSGFVLFRFTVTPAIHMLASFTVGLGINRGLLDWASRGTQPPRSSLVFYAIGMCIHAAYNTTVVVLYVVDVLND